MNMKLYYDFGVCAYEYNLPIEILRMYLANKFHIDLYDATDEDVENVGYAFKTDIEEEFKPIAEEEFKSRIVIGVSNYGKKRL